jgi:protein SCO1/2
VSRLRVLAMTLVLLVGSAGASAPTGFRGGTLEPPRPAPDFTLQAHDGSAFRLSEQRGHVVALVFGYTFCPDVCPTTLAELAQARARLEPRAAERLRVAFVTVDPERDDPGRLRVYTQAFDPTFVGLTGTLAELKAVQKSYGVIVKRHKAKGTAAAYLVDHSAFVYVIDADGRLRLMLPFGTSIDTLTHDIGLLLRR